MNVKKTVSGEGPVGYMVAYWHVSGQGSTCQLTYRKPTIGTEYAALMEIASVSTPMIGVNTAPPIIDMT